MPPGVIDELRDFHRFLGEKLGNGGAECSPEEALDEWRRLQAHSQDSADGLVGAASDRRIASFLDEVYALAGTSDLDTASDRIFDFVDRLLCDDQFDACDDVLEMVDVEKLPTTLMRSFLSITAAAKGKLPSRPALYRKIEQRMIELKGAEKTRTILGNLA
jgi:hypothetical protein